jgi:hypothetical protein
MTNCFTRSTFLLTIAEDRTMVSKDEVPPTPRMFTPQCTAEQQLRASTAERHVEHALIIDLNMYKPSTSFRSSKTVLSRITNCSLIWPWNQLLSCRFTSGCPSFSLFPSSHSYTILGYGFACPRALRHCHFSATSFSCPSLSRGSSSRNGLRYMAQSSQYGSDASPRSLFLIQTSRSN